MVFESQPPNTIISLSFTIPCYRIKLTGLWVNRPQRNHSITTFCEINVQLDDLGLVEGGVYTLGGFENASRFRDETRRQTSRRLNVKQVWNMLEGFNLNTDHDLVMKQGLRIHLKSLRPRREIVN